MHSANNEPPPLLSTRSAALPPAALAQPPPAPVAAHQVDALAAGRLHDGVVEIGLPRFDAGIEAESVQFLEFLAGSGGPDDLRADRLRRLQSGHADTRGHARDEQ